MKVKFIRQVADGKHVFHAGHELTVSDTRGATYIENGWAQEVQDTKVAPPTGGTRSRGDRARL